MTAPCPTPDDCPLCGKDCQCSGRLYRRIAQLERELAEARNRERSLVREHIENESRRTPLPAGAAIDELRIQAQDSSLAAKQAYINALEYELNRLRVAALSPQAPAGACQHIHQSWKKDDGYCDDCGASLSVPLVDAYPPIADPVLAVFQDRAAPPAAPSDEARDAARYRYLRDVGPKTPFGLCATDSDGHLQYGAELDAAIDAAVRGKP